MGTQRWWGQEGTLENHSHLRLNDGKTGVRLEGEVKGEIRVDGGQAYSC